METKNKIIESDNIQINNNSVNVPKDQIGINLDNKPVSNNAKYWGIGILLVLIIGTVFLMWEKNKNNNSVVNNNPVVLEPDTNSNIAADAYSNKLIEKIEKTKDTPGPIFTPEVATEAQSLIEKFGKIIFDQNLKTTLYLDSSRFPFQEFILEKAERQRAGFFGEENNIQGYFAGYVLPNFDTVYFNSYIMKYVKNKQWTYLTSATSLNSGFFDLEKIGEVQARVRYTKEADGDFRFEILTKNIK